jgi:hypothetical protein
MESTTNNKAVLAKVNLQLWDALISVELFEGK